MPISDGAGHLGPPLVSGAGSCAVTADMLAQIHGINRLFLDLALLAGRQGTALMPPSLASALAGLEAPMLDEVAHCTYALFDLHLDDGRLWQRLLVAPRTVGSGRESNGIAAVPGGELERFLEAALGYAWHLCQARESAARLLFGMPRLTFEVFRATSFCALMRSSDRAGGLLAARWADHPCFWPDLLLFAGRTDLRGLAPARLLGTQLIAADLAAASGAYA